MLRKDLHRLLRRQLKRTGLELKDERELSLLNLINEAYYSFDLDVGRLENILEESSKELFRANQILRHENEFAKSRLRNIVNNVHGVLFQTDQFGNFIYLNKAWNELTGLSWKRSLGKNYKDLLVGLNKAEKQRIKKFLHSRQEEYKTVFKYHKPNQEELWIDLNLSITRDNDGKTNGTIGTMVDVTSLKETEIKLNKASKAKDEFLSTMSHEIRTPLNAVIGLANVLLMERYLPEQKENLEALKYSGEHLLGLINNILDLNKIHSGNVHYVEADFSLDDMIKEIQSHFKVVEADKDVTFEIIKDKNIPDQLLGDRLMLIQVIKNLLSNAFKFTDEGLVRLAIKMKYIKNDVVKLGFRVSDTGIGIPMEKQKSIFDSFVQAEKNTSRLYGGTGLGLTISRKLLQFQNSDLHLNSREGEGSTFWFNIKLKLSQSNPQRSEESKKKSHTDLKDINLKILVAEDNLLNQMVLGKLLSKWNVYFKMTSNGQEAFQALQEDDYDLILMDLQMPVLDGYQATRKIRQLNNPTKAAIPVIALTAFAQEEAKLKTTEFEMNGFMTKPFDPLEFHKLLSFYGKGIQNTG